MQLVQSQPGLIAEDDSRRLVAIAQRNGRPVVRGLRMDWTAARVGVAAVDFSQESIDAARLLHRLLPDKGTLYLVHVIGNHPRAELIFADLDVGFEVVIRREFDILEEHLHSRDRHLRVVEVWRTGIVANEVLDFARSNRADVVAMGCSAGGSHDGTSDDGRVARAVLEATRIPILLVPARSRACDANSFVNRRQLREVQSKVSSKLDQPSLQWSNEYAQ